MVDQCDVQRQIDGGRDLFQVCTSSFKWDVGGMHWIDLAHNGDRWRAFVNAVMNLLVA